MKKNEMEMDFKFDWVIKKAAKGEITPVPVEDYKQQLKQKLEYRPTPKDAEMKDDEDKDEEMD
jgi:hypothetical protein